MDPGGVATRVGIVRHPHIPSDMLLQNEDVPASRGNHSRRWCRSWKPQPVGGEIQSGHDAAEHTYRCAATAESAGATGRAPTDDLTTPTVRFRDCMAL